MNLETLYRQIKGYIDSVEFSRLWEGFAPLKFALYTDTECYFHGRYIPKTDAFLGNTAISFEEEMIAIWLVSGDPDPVVLASKLIHEMFHGFQRLQGESRFPDEMEALFRYKHDEGNLSAKLEENRLIAGLTEQFDPPAFQRLLEMRKYRSDRFPYEFHYEACTEQIEGTAQFVELKALEQLSPALFVKETERLKSRIVTESNLLPVRIICYDVGALLLLLLEKNGVAYDKSFGCTPFAEGLLAGAEEYRGEIPLTMKEAMEGYFRKAEDTIREGLLKNDLAAEGEFDLLGVNVYNAVYHRGYVISTFFVMFAEGGEQRVEYGDFLIETNEKKKMTRLFRL